MGQITHHPLDLRKAQTQLLRNQNKAHPANIRTQKSPLIAARSDGFEQPFILVKPDRRDTLSGAARHVTDGDEVFMREFFSHVLSIAQKKLELKLG